MSDILAGLILLYLVLTIGEQWDKKDDTDPPSGRSGLVVLTDQRTGCQYLGRSFGGVTPRLDRGGKHICKEIKP